MDMEEKRATIDSVEWRRNKQHVTLRKKFVHR